MTLRALPILIALALASLASIRSLTSAAETPAAPASPGAPAAAKPGDRVRPEDMNGVSFEGLSDEAREVVAIGATGTPTSFVNGRFLVGAQQFETFQRVVDEEIAKASKRAAGFGS